jgi:mannan endo-1,4-beta-mannosidase
MTPSYPKSTVRRASRRRVSRIKRSVGFVTCAVVVIGAAVAVLVIRPRTTSSIHPVHSVRYLGVFQPDAPYSYADLDQFAQAIGRQPNLVIYYNYWLQPFQVNFATSAAKRGATTLVQIDATNISLSKIATGRYDTYLRSYATAVKAFRDQVVLSFGHEMNGNWYTWGYQHTPAKVFVAAWRHIVTVFRAAGARNVTWLWTVNIIAKDGHVPDPASWWPGSSYVNWVGVDGYYYTNTQTFAQVFGPTIVDVRALTSDPILIAETGASLAAGQAAKITDLFAGIQGYGLLGFAWFDYNDTSQGLNWRLSSPEALAAYRRDAKAFMRPPATPVPTQHPSSGTPST